MASLASSSPFCRATSAICSPSLATLSAISSPFFTAFSAASFVFWMDSSPSFRVFLASFITPSPLSAAAAFSFVLISPTFLVCFPFSSAPPVLSGIALRASSENFFIFVFATSVILTSSSVRSRSFSFASVPITPKVFSGSSSCIFLAASDKPRRISPMIEIMAKIIEVILNLVAVPREVCSLSSSSFWTIAVFAAFSPFIISVLLLFVFSGVLIMSTGNPLLGSIILC